MGVAGNRSENADDVAELVRASSGQEFLHDFALDIRQPEIAALETVSQTRVVEAEEMQEGGV